MCVLFFHSWADSRVKQPEIRGRRPQIPRANDDTVNNMMQTYSCLLKCSVSPHICQWQIALCHNKMHKGVNNLPKVIMDLHLTQKLNPWAFSHKPDTALLCCHLKYSADADESRALSTIAQYKQLDVCGEVLKVNNVTRTVLSLSLSLKAMILRCTETAFTI